MRHFFFFFFLAAAPALAQDFPVTVTDQANREVRIEAPPERAMCFLPDCIQHLAAIGLLPAAAFQGDIELAAAPNTLGERASEITAFSWTGDGPDLEAILAFAPDFIFGNMWMFDDPSYDILFDNIPFYLTAGHYPDWSKLNLEDDAENVCRITLELLQFYQD